MMGLMLAFTWRAPLCLILGGVTHSWFASTVVASEQEDFDTQVRLLASERFADREAAAQRLYEKAFFSLPALNRAKESAEPEVARRAQAILDRIFTALAVPHAVRRVAFAPDRRTALVLGDPAANPAVLRGPVYLKDLNSGKPVRFLDGLPETVGAIDLSPDGRLAVCGGQQVKVDRRADPRSETVDFSIRHWNLPEDREVRRLTGHLGQVTSVTFSPDGRYVLSTGGLLPYSHRSEGGPTHDCKIRLWNLASGAEERCFVGHTHFLRYAIFSPDGQRILSCGGGDDPTLRLWEVATGRELRQIRLNTGVYSTPKVKENATVICFLPDGRRLLLPASFLVEPRTLPTSQPDRYIYENGLLVLDTDSGMQVSQIAGVRGRIDCLAVSPDGQRALSGGAGHVVQLWDLEAGRELKRFEVGVRYVAGVAFTPDGQRAVCLCHDGTAFTWDLPR